MRRSSTVKAIATIATIWAAPLAAQSGMDPVARADVEGKDGISGEVVLFAAPQGVLARITLSGSPEGLHGIHLHETGDCSADDFKSAGGHIAGDAQHGFLVENGPHPGDMPNAVVKASGMLEVDAFLPDIDVEQMIFDKDGAAFILHAGTDDYASQPSGDAGSRLACGVFEAAN